MCLPRMTTRRWMVAVALVRLLLTLAVRQKRLRRIATYHCDQAIANYDLAPHKRGGPPPTSFRFTSRGMWHLKMMNSYNESADRYTLLLGTGLTLSGMHGLAIGSISMLPAALGSPSLPTRPSRNDWHG
jgi:hypothetical protein